jgi:acetoacetyl-CoA synthetase
MATGEGEVLWSPSPQRVAASRMAKFQRWLADERRVDTTGYQSLWRWSVNSPNEFWLAVWHHFDVIATRTATVALADPRMPGSQWFPGAELNWAENLLRHSDVPSPAIVSVAEDGTSTIMSRPDLIAQVANLAGNLRAMRVQPGDRIAAVLPNIAPTVVALLASASIGAVWSCCAPDFGTRGLVDRFAQIEPTVLIGVDGYRYDGEAVTKLALFEDLCAELPTVKHAVLVRNLRPDAPVPAGMHDFGALVEGNATPDYIPLPFNHPLWILYSSGTTGTPKGIVHSHGGMLLESLKANALHYDLGPQDRLFIAASTAWVVWNMLVNAMSTGATIITYDGSPLAYGADTLFALCAAQSVTRFGTGAAYLTKCEKSGMAPGKSHDLSALRSILSTGSPLPDSTFRWVYDSVKHDVHLGSDSGGTDVATAFVGANPLQPVHVGELQGPCLGVAVQAWNESGTPVTDEVGEMVITVPMPSMPIYFWNDSDGARYREAYFTVFPDVWRQGDWITMSPTGGCVVHGRSDSTINRGGVRMGSADIYGAVEELPEVSTSLVVGVELAHGGYYMPLFVVLVDGQMLDTELKKKIQGAIRTTVSPRHVPDDIIAVPSIPMTRTGKRLEIPVKKLLQGVPKSDVINPTTLAAPNDLDWYSDYASCFLAATESGARGG